MIQFPGGFLGWIDPRPLPRHLIDGSACDNPPTGGAASLHLSGGTNELERQSHDQPPAVRKAAAEMRDRLHAGLTPDLQPRIISAAAVKVERLTGLLQALLPHAEGLILPCASDIAFSSVELLERCKDFEVGRYHFPLYSFAKVRPDEDGPYVSTTGMFIFGLPDVAMPYGGELGPQEASEALGELQREMVAEGWWPEEGAGFDTVAGPVGLTRTGGGIFAVPGEVELDPDAVAAARYPSVVHRVRGEDLITDHHLVLDGASCAITNGLGLTTQKGSTPEDENERVEVALIGNAVGAWSTGWLAWIASALRGHDGSHPFRPFDRVALDEPVGDIAGAILWPRGEPWDAGLDAPVNVWAMVPILTEELAAFRAMPGAQRAWMKERLENGDVETLFDRWAQVVPRR
jgi:hypothetical protein